MFIAVANTGATRVMTSTDGGNTWTGRTQSSVHAWSGVAASPTLVMAYAGADTKAMKSADGINWSDAAADPANFSQILAQGSNNIVYSTVLSKFAIPGYDTTGPSAKVAYTTDGSSWSYSTAAPLTNYFTFIAFVAANAYGGFLGSLPFDPSATPTPTIIGESDDAGSTWVDDDTTFSGFWQVAGWDDSNGIFVAWDGTPSDTMLVGIFGPFGLAISPDTGFTSGGLNVSVTGGDGNFAVGTRVFFGRFFGERYEATNVVVADGTHLTCDTPPFPEATLVSLIIENPLPETVGIKDAFTYVEPSDSGGSGSFTLSPDDGPTSGGTVVTITAVDFVFGATPRVTFDGIPATSVSGGGTSILTCTTPPHVRGAVSVIVYDS
jgi:hypothetical protein